MERDDVTFMLERNMLMALVKREKRIRCYLSNTLNLVAFICPP